MQSIWSATVKPERFPALEGNVKTDVLIIGGGMAGVLCAYFLHKAAVPYLLVEGGELGGGITKNTTAKITAQHGLLYQKLLKSIGAERAGLYLRLQQQALEQYRTICGDIDCDFVNKDAYVYSLTDWKAIEKEISALQTIGYHSTYANTLPLAFDIAGAVRFADQAQFHPLKFIRGIAKELHIHERTLVRELAPHRAITQSGTITAKHIIIASHFPFLNKHGLYFLKLYQHRSYAIALENAADVNGMYLEEKKEGLSFRNQGNLLIVGGGDHKTGKKGGNWQALRDFAADAYPSATERYAWATQDCMTLDGIPYIGYYGKSAEGIYVATGFNKWGMTSSMVAAKILTDMILEHNTQYAALFSPQRSILKPQLLLNGLSAVGNLLTPAAKRCPHMGCALKWNPAERSWDCPCHGSRFDSDGALLDNPATGGIENKV